MVVYTRGGHFCTWLYLRSNQFTFSIYGYSSPSSVRLAILRKKKKKKLSNASARIVSLVKPMFHLPDVSASSVSFARCLSQYCFICQMSQPVLFHLPDVSASIVSFARYLSQYCFICQMPVISRAQYMLFNLSNISSHVVSRMVKNALRQNSRIFIITRIEVYPMQPFLFVWKQAVILIGKRGGT